jgi:hypothetical protein
MDPRSVPLPPKQSKRIISTDTIPVISFKPLPLTWIYVVRLRTPRSPEKVRTYVCCMHVLSTSYSSVTQSIICSTLFGPSSRVYYITVTAQYGQNISCTSTPIYAFIFPCTLLGRPSGSLAIGLEVGRENNRSLTGFLMEGWILFFHHMFTASRTN